MNYNVSLNACVCVCVCVCLSLCQERKNENACENVFDVKEETITLYIYY